MRTVQVLKGIKGIVDSGPTLSHPVQVTVFPVKLLRDISARRTVVPLRNRPVHG